MRDLVHPPSALTGAAVAMALAVPTALLAQALDASDVVDDDSNWLVVLFVVVLAGLAVGGYVAATRRPDAPLTNSALAALVAYALVQVISVVRLLAAGDDVAWEAIPFFALLAAAAGMSGGLVADRRARTGR